ncbi:MAG: hypothetical protein FJ005_02055 [Chloroflexi bacterium]|nr:hypothetical protein [Chloroflexota bacterium]
MKGIQKIVFAIVLVAIMLISSMPVIALAQLGRTSRPSCLHTYSRSPRSLRLCSYPTRDKCRRRNSPR